MTMPVVIIIIALSWTLFCIFHSLTIITLSVVGCFSVLVYGEFFVCLRFNIIFHDN